jgi:hypothetical protein
MFLSCRCSCLRRLTCLEILGRHIEQDVGKLRAHNRHAMSGYSQTRSEAIAGCSERLAFSPAQPRRAKTRRSAGKAAANEEGLGRG